MSDDSAQAQIPLPLPPPSLPSSSTTTPTQTRRNERRAVRSIYATPREPTDSPTPISSPTPTPKRQRIRKTDSQTSLDLAPSSNASLASSSPLPSTPNPPTTNKSSKYKIGMAVEARDSAKEWYKARVVEIDENEQPGKVKIHFQGWNSRFDQWFDVKSNDLRPLRPSSSDHEQINYESGAKVMAKWKDEFYYGAYVIRQVEKDVDPDVKYYEIRFTDKVRRIVRGENLRPPTDEELLYVFVDTKTTQTVSDNPKLSESSSNLVETVKNDEEETDDAKKRRAEAELLLSMQQQVLETAVTEEKEEVVEMNPPIESVPVMTSTTEIESNQQPPPPPPTTPIDASNRKSLRVKRLRTYTEEIVFDSPSASIAYNLASVHKQISLPAATTATPTTATDLKASVSLSTTSSKKRKRFDIVIKLFVFLL